MIVFAIPLLRRFSGPSDLGNLVKSIGVPTDRHPNSSAWHQQQRQPHPPDNDPCPQLRERSESDMDTDDSDDDDEADHAQMDDNVLMDVAHEPKALRIDGTTMMTDPDMIAAASDDDLCLLSLCQNTKLSRPHNPNLHKLRGPMKDSPVLSAIHTGAVSPALQFHHAWEFLSPRDRVNTVKAWPQVMHPHARLRR